MVCWEQLSYLAGAQSMCRKMEENKARNLACSSLHLADDTTESLGIYQQTKR